MLGLRRRTGTRRQRGQRVGPNRQESARAHASVGLLRGVAHGGEKVAARQGLIQRLVAHQKLLEIDQITLAAIHGGAVGGAACIVTALDFRIGTDTCFVSYPEINLGMSLSWYGLPLCVHLVGPARAKRMVILGNKEPAKVLLEWGFLDEVVPEKDLHERAMQMALEYASKPPAAAQMIKRSVNAISSALDQSIMHMDIDQLLLTFTTDDFLEGISAQREKRDPQFKGR